MFRLIANVLSLLVALLLAGTGLAPDQLLAQSRSTSASSDDLLKTIGVGRMPAGSRAPDFSLRDLNGQTVSQSTYGGGLVFLNFWATWCGPCRQEMPSMERLHRALGRRGLVMLAVNQRENSTKVASFMREYGLGFPALLDSDGRVSSSYRVWGLPTTFLIDGTGRLMGKRSGPRDWASPRVMDVFARLIGETQSAGGVGAPLVPGPAEPLPAMVRVKTQSSPVHSQQDGESEVLDKLRRGEELALLGTASGAGEFWYMIKTKAGAIGWIRGTDVEEVRQAK